MEMSKRLEILKASLAKKEALFNKCLQNHFDTVKQTNGQPLNDKRNGRATLNKWEKQNDALRNIEKSIQKTKDAIEHEENKTVTTASIDIPDYLRNAINEGIIVQWRKFPRFFFVNGVKSGRIVLNEKTGTISHRYVNKIPKEEYPIFRDVFNSLYKQAIN
ncbi:MULTISPECIES: hypothetical protein [Photorhabdus]|uniref:hypothetical protein n=1 Tax=Photorhabdus TaxID=29487 RepID=UPI0021D514C8|nr:hypothetical protein [Photorhabdus kayaii]MCT8353863.1 hypothetical protein [Photorhabdus kayaii]